MFEDERRENGGGSGFESAHVGTEVGCDWREIDRELRRVAKARGGLDADELLWLARAERAEIHRQLGHATILEYVERVLGYGPRVAHERLRVARALEGLPALRAELESARLSYSAVREVTRVAKPWTEGRWIQRVTGLSLREVEEAVAGHEPGDDPDDPTKPDLALRRITFELSPRTLALWRETTPMLEDEVGHPLTDDELFATLCAGALRDRAVPDDDTDDDDQPDDVSVPRAHVGTQPAPYQIAFTLCVSCKRATHDAAGRSFDVPQSAVEQALCNAQHLGRVDADTPARASRDVPPATARLVWRRDGGHCVVPGCRSTRHIEIHHIRYRRDGIDHSPGNLACLCFAHHTALHEGRLVITGTAPDALVFERRDPLMAPVMPPAERAEGAILRPWMPSK